VSAPAQRRIATNGIELQVTEAGEGFPVVLCHGFPELSYSWRHQIGVLADAGYHVIAPDQRGYGHSSAPEAIADYDMVHLTDDIAGLLDALGEERAVVIGHDWGSMVAWSCALRYPERLAGVVGMSVPFVPRPSGPPTEIFRQLFVDTFFYMLYFQEPGPAEADLERDPQITMRRFMAGLAAETPVEQLADMFGPLDGRGLIDRLPEAVDLPAWIDQSEIDHYASEFAHSGFRGPLNWYRNLDRNWELSAEYADKKVEVPAGFIAGALDPVLTMTPPSVMEGWVTDLRTSVLIGGAAHWVQQERPKETNQALLEYLGGLNLSR
jgi:pimeloyl-ACP methyl ester carboxylesterase